MNFPHHIFKAYDIRGVAGDELDDDLARRIGRALGALARERGVGEFVIGRDGRISGARLGRAVARGVRDSGCDAIDIGMAPTPVVYHAAARRRGAVVVTASHNPPQYNGMKMMIGDDTLCDDAIQQLKQRVLDDLRDDSRDDDSPNPIARGALRHEDAIAAYQQSVLDDIRLARALRIVIDCGNGVAGVIAPRLFRALGCEVVELFCEVDGRFPNHHPDPSRAENLAALIAEVRRAEADFGIAFDGDGDRLGVVAIAEGEGEGVDGDDAIISPDRLLVLFAQDLLANTPGAEILFDVKCSRVLPAAIRAHGGVATMCRTGHSFIKNKLRETGAALAGEMSGHIFFNDRWGGFDDGLYAAARLCELLAADSRAPASVFADLPDAINTPELRVEMNEGEAHQLIAEITARLQHSDRLPADADFADADITTVDGIRADFAHGFGLARASNTTPTLILRFEADSLAQLEDIQSRFRKLLHAARAELALPF
ncbi:MAG: phosphomannomutase/phosphoglucomutase [bacterium]